MAICNEATIVLAYTRSIVLILCTLGGILSIVLGWKLYKDSVVSQVKGELRTSGLKFVLTAASPGIAMIAFGMALLIMLVWQPYQHSRIDTETKTSQALYELKEKGLDASYSLLQLNREGIILTQAVTPPPKSAPQKSFSEKCDCVISRTTKEEKIVYASGIDRLSKKRIEIALGHAIKALEKDAPDTSLAAMERTDVLVTLRALDSANKGE